MLKTKFSNWLRRNRLLHLADKVHFAFQFLRQKSRNKQFLSKTDEKKLPPAYILYEAYRIDYASYLEDGLASAEELVNFLGAHIVLEKAQILDWGCGPGRITRHIPTLLPGAGIYGCDYNRATIEWCKENIRDVVFFKNELAPPLPIQADTFDGVIAISVFTHLSLQQHHLWIDEMQRVIKPGGVFLFSTQGQGFKSKLNTIEKTHFESGKLVTRGKVKEGHRTFSAFHPDDFIKSAFSPSWDILQHIPGKAQNWGISQDIWIVRKKI